MDVFFCLVPIFFPAKFSPPHFTSEWRVHSPGIGVHAEGTASRESSDQGWGVGPRRFYTSLKRSQQPVCLPPKTSGKFRIDRFRIIFFAVWHLVWKNGGQTCCSFQGPGVDGNHRYRIFDGFFCKTNLEVDEPLSPECCRHLAQTNAAVSPHQFSMI